MGYEIHPNVIAQQLYIDLRRVQTPEAFNNDPAGDYLEWRAPVLTTVAKDLVGGNGREWVSRLAGTHGTFVLNKGRYYWHFDAESGFVVFRRYIENSDFVPGVVILWGKEMDEKVGKVIGKTEDGRLNVKGINNKFGEAIEYEDVIAIDIGIVLNGEPAY